MSFATEYVEIIEDILKVLSVAAAEDRGVSKKKLSAEIQIKYGRTAKKVDEYLAALVTVGKIKVNGDEILLV